MNLLDRIRAFFKPTIIHQVIPTKITVTGTDMSGNAIIDNPVVERYPINMAIGDTCHIEWNFKLEYDANRGLVKIFDGPNYIGTIPQEDGYEAHHTLDIEYQEVKDE